MSGESSFNDIFSDEDLNRLLMTAARLEKFSYAIEAAFILVAAGYLGLRTGEIIHFDPDWVDRENQIIIIPSKWPCDCSYCDDLASRYAERHDISKKEAKEKYWKPKTDRGHRTIPYGAYPNVVPQTIEKFCDYMEENQEDLFASTVARRLRLIGELTPGIDRAKVIPRVLRATAASRLARLGITITALQRLFGWRFPHVAAYYLWMSGKTTKRELRRIHRKPSTPKDEYIRILRYNPPTFEEWRENASRIIPPEYTPTDLNETGMLDRLHDDEEELIQQEVLQSFTKDILGPLAAESDASEIEDKEELDEIDDHKKMMMVAIPGLIQLINGSQDLRTRKKHKNDTKSLETTTGNQVLPSTERASKGVTVYGGLVGITGYSFAQLGIGLDLASLQVYGDPIMITKLVAIMTVTTYLLLRQNEL